MAIIHCSKQKPWDHKSDPGDQIVHEDAHEVGEQRGDVISYHCPNCGMVWKQELPQ